MKMKKIIGILLLGFMAVLLVACGQKSAEEMIKTELKDSYTGSSKVSAYDGLVFTEGGQELVFDKNNHSIKNGEKEMYYKIVSEESLPTEPKVALKDLEPELKGTDNFTIAISYKKGNLSNSDSFYQIALTEGGKKIRIIELRRDYAAEGGYYDFSGDAD